MFHLKSNAEIGAYFANLVKKSNFKSMRQFGKAYLQTLGKPTNNESLQNMSDKLAQIKNGKNSIQLSDLPVFTHLLGVTCEQLLSAGEYCVPAADYMTIRQFAATHDPADWETFVQREDKPFLNLDEFGKNAIEYALEFKNYDLLKYLMDQGYIWFIGPDSKEYYKNFSAGTSIKRRDPRTLDVLPYDLHALHQDTDRLRRQMICLALDRKDFEMLGRLKAREIPTLYGLPVPNIADADLDIFYDEDLIHRIADADDCVIDYFSQEFTIPERHHPERINTYIFPYISDVLKILLERNHPCAEAVLKRCAEHNKKFLDHLETVITKIVAHNTQMYEETWSYDRNASQEDIYQYSLRNLYFFRCNDIVTSWSALDHDGGVTNLVFIDNETDNFRLAPLINDINTSYNKVMEIQKHSR